MLENNVVFIENNVFLKAMFFLHDFTHDLF